MANTLKKDAFVFILALIIVFFASNITTADSAKILSTDNNLELENTGIIYDTDTGLEWYPAPDRAMTWQEAHAWAAGLDVLGGGWRMPARRELAALRRIGDGVRNLTPLLPSSGYWIWAGQTRDEASRWLFGFSYGGEGWSGQPPDDGGRAIAVRRRAKPP